MSRSILITGCSSGIGLDAAQTLKARGWHVFASCRKEADCDRLRSLGFDSPRIDYEDEDSIRTGLEQVLTVTGGRLDALFNNGAYAIPGAVEDLPRGAIRAIFEANLFGWLDLTNRVIPVMRAQGSGRIVMCSSVLGITTIPWRGAYVATKFALEGLTDTLRLEMQDTPIEVSLIEPGPITTRIRENARTGFERWIDWENSARAERYAILRQRLYGDRGKDRFELPPAAVTDKLIHAIESSRPKARYFVTKPTWGAEALRRFLPTRTRDRILSR